MAARGRDPVERGRRRARGGARRRGVALRAPAAAWGDERGAALVEFALVGAMLIMMVLGVIEFGNVYSATHTLTSLSREGANLAARGATLAEALENVVANGADLQLAARGGAVASRIVVRDGIAEIDEQRASPGYESRSRLGAAGGPAANVEPWGLEEDQVVHAVEIFYGYDSVTPFEGVFGVAVPDTLYERGIF